MKKGNLSDEQKKFLECRLGDIALRQPKFVGLVEKLLSIGGHMVVSPGCEDDVDKILSRGKVFGGRRSQLIRGRRSRCHENSAVLWDKNKGSLKLVTGYALTADDGLWRQHSFLFREADGRVIETTEKRQLYFGYELTSDEAEDFYVENAL